MQPENLCPVTKYRYNRTKRLVIMKTQQLIIAEPENIEIQEMDLDENLESHQALIRTEYSIVSAGTEGAGFTGLVKEMPYGDAGQYPRTTGYGNLGEVIEVGSTNLMCKTGDRVLSFSQHASHVKADATRMALPVPLDFPGEKMVFARMAGVSISALRSSTVQPGDTVLIIGMGLVGIFAAQLFMMAGADVMVCDLSEYRLQRARECGIKRTVQSQDLNKAVDDWTAGNKARIVVEAIGISEVIHQAVSQTARYGEVILLGSPRASATFDVTPMLLRIHLEAIRVIGSLEWRWPIHETDRTRDIVNNYRMIIDWIATEKLQVSPLLDQLASPTDCQRIYSGLTEKREDYLGAVFDWSQI